MQFPETVGAPRKAEAGRGVKTGEFQLFQLFQLQFCISIICSEKGQGAKTDEMVLLLQFIFKIQMYFLLF